MRGSRSRELCGFLCLSLTFLQKTSHIETELGGPALQLPVIVAQSLSHVQLFVTPWTTVCQAPLSFTISWSLLKRMSIESKPHFLYLLPYLVKDGASQWLSGK